MLSTKVTLWVLPGLDVPHQDAAGKVGARIRRQIYISPCPGQGQDLGCAITALLQPALREAYIECIRPPPQLLGSTWVSKYDTGGSSLHDTIFGIETCTTYRISERNCLNSVMYDRQPISKQ